MINDEKRREVADKMRGYDVSEFKESAIVPFLECLGHGYTNWRGVLDELADLIEPHERTCTNESASGKYFACSECGAELMQITPGWVALIRGSVNYCPNCGARVTGGARIEEESDDTI